MPERRFCLKGKRFKNKHDLICRAFKECDVCKESILFYYTHMFGHTVYGKCKCGVWCRTKTDSSFPGDCHNFILDVYCAGKDYENPPAHLLQKSSSALPEIIATTNTLQANTLSQIQSSLQTLSPHVNPPQSLPSSVIASTQETTKTPEPPKSTTENIFSDSDLDDLDDLKDLEDDEDEDGIFFSPWSPDPSKSAKEVVTNFDLPQTPPKTPEEPLNSTHNATPDVFSKNTTQSHDDPVQKEPETPKVYEEAPLVHSLSCKILKDSLNTARRSYKWDEELLNVIQHTRPNFETISELYNHLPRKALAILFAKREELSTSPFFRTLEDTYRDYKCIEFLAGYEKNGHSLDAVKTRLEERRASNAQIIRSTSESIKLLQTVQTTTKRFTPVPPPDFSDDLEEEEEEIATERTKKQRSQ